MFGMVVRTKQKSIVQQEKWGVYAQDLYPTTSSISINILIARYAPIYEVFRHGQLGKSPMVAPTVSTTVTKMRSNCIKELKLQPVTISGKGSKTHKVLA